MSGRPDPAGLFQRWKIAWTEIQSASLAAAFSRCSADEGTLWLLDEEGSALVPVWNSGPHADRFVGRHRQPLRFGLISLVCVSGQALCENDVYRNAGQDPALDQTLGVLTCAMIAVPLLLRGEPCGVISCVKLKPAGNAGPDPAPFQAEDLAVIAGAAEDFARKSGA